VLGSLKRFFEERVAPEASRPTPEARERALRLAAAALLFEVVRADALVRDEERTVMRAAIQRTFGLSGDEADELVALAEYQSREAASV